ncbi:MAG: sulfatase-like hydrolase/transferase [Planctomycetes bacterium]|nr:sulfatase-like hydrolase/transferase [Planctomycetota bacterium]
MISLAHATELPNFVIILSDDQGWNATSAPVDPAIPESGSSYYRTPQLDRLISEGTCFSQAYSSSPTCGPSRHSIQYGRSPVSLQIFASAGWGKVNFTGKAEESMARTLKKAHPEYRTAHFGKWHVTHTQEDMGYDVVGEGKGNSGGRDATPDDPKKIFSLTEKGNRFMEEQVKAGKPFFLQISHFANHLPYQSLQKTKKKYETEHADKATKYQNDPLWAGMNEDLDTGVGMTLDKIRELGIKNNTYVIYTSDNGYEGKICQTNSIEERLFYKGYPLVSHKYTINEGGLRVPFIIRGPDVPAGIKCKTRIVAHDIFPTILDILGKKDVVPTSVDGGSLWPLLKSAGTEKVIRTDPYLVFRYTRDARDICIIQDDFKLLKELATGKMHLFDLTKDLGERTNLMKEYPEKASKMYAALTEHLKRHDWEEGISQPARGRGPNNESLNKKVPKKEKKAKKNKKNKKEI